MDRVSQTFNTASDQFDHHCPPSLVVLLQQCVQISSVILLHAVDLLHSVAALHLAVRICVNAREGQSCSKCVM